MKTKLVGALAVFAFASAPAIDAATPVTGVKRMVASDNVQATANTLQSGLPNQFQKRFWFAYGGTVRLKWEMRSPTGANGAVDIQPASFPQLCFKGTNSQTFVRSTCDVDVPAGGTLILRPSDFPGQPEFQIRRVTASYDIVAATRATLVLEN
jgi:hypothetical protein